MCNFKECCHESDHHYMGSKTTAVGLSSATSSDFVTSSKSDLKNSIMSTLTGGGGGGGESRHQQQLNSEERLKLMRYQRYFRCAGVGIDDCISRVNKMRKRLFLKRQKTLSILDEDGFPESSKER